ncbi:DNA-dependent RNA polymerase [Poronia punctata]|nr:DNA-dependent RNA polymerase [Poronia punctata]
MLQRYSRAPNSGSLPRIQTLRRPDLPSRCHSAQFMQYTSISTRWPLLTRPGLSPWRRKTCPMTYNNGHRLLATAVEGAMRQEDVTLSHIHSHISPTYMQPPPPHTPLYHLRAFDPATALQIKIKDGTLPRHRVSTSGIPGGIDEMLSLFDACIDVNKLERAALVLQRLSQFRDDEGLPGSKLVLLHNQYLRAGVVRALEQPESRSAESLHQWFEVQIREKNVPYTPETIAYMLKATLLSSQGSELSGLVTRYLNLLPEESTWPVLDAGILNQQDFGTITSIYQPISNLATGDWGSLGDDASPEPNMSSDPSVCEEPQSESNVAPDVLAVPQKGLGLETLRGVLSFFDQIDGKGLARLSSDERREIQARLEKDCVEAAIQRWRVERENLAKMGRNTSLSKYGLNSKLYDWQCSLEEQIQEDLDLVSQSEEREKKTSDDLERCIYGPFMRQSTAARLAAVTIMTVLNCLAQNGADQGVPLSGLVSNVAKATEDDVRLQVRQRRMAESKIRLKKKEEDQQVSYQSRRATDVTVSDIRDGDEPTPTGTNSHILGVSKFDFVSWPVLVKAKLGARLLAALIASANVTVTREHPKTKELVSQIQPALAHTRIHRKGKTLGVVLPNKALVEMMKQEPRGDYLARHLPMLVEPTPWSKFDSGGFIQSPSQLVRIKGGEEDQRVYAKAAIQRGDLEQACKGLDVLGKTAWQINKPVFEVLLEAWNSGEKLANIPPLHPSIPVPEEPPASEDPLVRRVWLRRVKAVENEKSGLHSERCFMNFQLDIARAFRDLTFYFPHNMDFRGRAYPLPAYLNHMGADHVRGLLRFAKGRELGERGLYWLKIQLANVFGFDKASLQEREAFATEHLKDVYDSAAKPLSGGRWWLKAEDPWQCLAACFELRAALESPDPTKYVSQLPVHQDGTCNGLQHYAALGGDLWGAQQVNLTPGDRPADVYSAVAELVKKQITEDAAADNFMAKAVEGKITRKVVKQTVMTNVYGVTFTGAKAQVQKQLEAAYPDLESQAGIPITLISSYVVTKTFNALSTMFRGAHDIQYWLGECAGRVCRSISPEVVDQLAAEGSATSAKRRPAKGRNSSTAHTKDDTQDLAGYFRSTIVWTTPLRMPVVQPYRKNSARHIPTCIQELRLATPDRSDPVNRRKQLQAFPPNFIHSLDASHMLLSALECDELGLTFAAVHDSFWTHAADIDAMNRVLRDAFVRIHSEDVIGRLACEFKARYEGYLQLTKIPRSSATGVEVAKWRRSQKIGLKRELLMERQRQKLISSSDPKEVAKGLDMVTPASIYEKLSSADETLPVNEDIDEVALGGLSNAELGESEEGENMAVRKNDLGMDTERVQGLMKVTHFEATLKKMSGPQSKKSSSPMEIWVPITFPDIPVKGDFDVTQLKDSQYFFS